MAIYFDNAATSYPKPPGVLRAMEEALALYGGNPGHGGHQMAMRAAGKLYGVREAAARFFGAEPENLVFTPGCTYALNQAIRGAMAGGGRVLVSMYGGCSSRCTTTTPPSGRRRRWSGRGDARWGISPSMRGNPGGRCRGCGSGGRPIQKRSSAPTPPM